MRLPAVALAVAALAGAARGATSEWRPAAPLPVARTEVAAAAVGDRIAVVGGFLPSGGSSARADLYDPATNRWRRLPDLPLAVNHAMAAGYRGRLYVAGGYGPHDSRAAFVWSGRAWRRLPEMPAPRGAAGAAVVGTKLYVVGGVGARGLATSTLIFDLVRNRWSSIRGPTPREHLAVAAGRGRVYAVAGRLGGLDSNLRHVEAYDPKRRAWTRLPPVPEARGGTGAAVSGRFLVSVGGEAPDGTIASVYALDVERRRWQRLRDLRTPRHGLGVVALRGRVYAIGGGPRPGLFVSDANEFLPVP